MAQASRSSNPGTSYTAAFCAEVAADGSDFAWMIQSVGQMTNLFAHPLIINSNWFSIFSSISVGSAIEGSRGRTGPGLNSFFEPFDSH